MPYERTRAPEPEPSRQRTIAELCSTKDFVEWVTTVADFQGAGRTRGARRSTGGRGSGRSGGSRIETLAKIPMIMCDLPKVPLRDKKGLVGNPPHWQSRYFRGGAPHDSYHHQVSESGRPGRPGGGTYPPQGHTLGGRPPRFSPARHSSVIFQAGGLRGELQALRTGFPDDL